jgi:hypothetical protein
MVVGAAGGVVPEPVLLVPPPQALKPKVNKAAVPNEASTLNWENEANEGSADRACCV